MICFQVGKVFWLDFLGRKFLTDVRVILIYKLIIFVEYSFDQFYYLIFLYLLDLFVFYMRSMSFDLFRIRRVFLRTGKSVFKVK